MEKNKRIVREFFEGYFIHHDKSLPDRYLASDYVLHDPSAPDFSGGREEFKMVQDKFFNAFPDHRLTIDDQFADGDKVVTRWTARGTQENDLPGCPSAGKHAVVTGITVSRISDGKIAEEWQNWDTLGLMKQLGPECSL
jgi:steroid delta-isomerase-like uncharacterized protein